MRGAAEEARLELLVWTEDGRVHNRVAAMRAVVAIASRASDGTGHKPAVEAPVEAEPWAARPRLILEVSCLVEPLVVVDAERTYCGWHRTGSPDLWREETGGHAGHHYVSR